ATTATSRRYGRRRGGGRCSPGPASTRAGWSSRPPGRRSTGPRSSASPATRSPPNSGSRSPPSISPRAASSPGCGGSSKRWKGSDPWAVGWPARNQPGCPGLLDGAAPPCELLDHLAGCRRCQEVLEQLAVGESGWLRFAPDGGSDRDRPPRLQQTMEDLKRLPLSGEPAAGAELPPDFLRPSDHPGALGAVGPYPVLEGIGRGGGGGVVQGLGPARPRGGAGK